MSRKKNFQSESNKNDTEVPNAKSDVNSETGQKVYNWLVYGLVIFFTLPPPLYLLLQLPYIAIITILIFTLSSLAIWLIPSWLIKGVKSKKSNNEQSEFDRERDYLKLLDDTRKTTAQILGGLFFIISLGVTYYTYDLTKQRLLTERFSEAVKLLEHNKDPFIQTAGMYELQNISRESNTLNQAILDVSILYITKRSAEITDSNCSIKPGENNRDILIAAEIIGSRVSNSVKRDFLIELQGRFYDNTKIFGENFNNAKLIDANFNNALFINSCFIKADLRNAKLVDTKFNGASLTDAILTNADISGADFSDSNLSESQIKDIRLDYRTIVPPRLENAKNKRIAYLDDLKKKLKPSDF